MSTLLFALALALGLATVAAFHAGRRCGFSHGYGVGKGRGVAEEWQRQHFDRIEAEKARRAANGQFRSTRKQPEPAPFFAGINQGKPESIIIKTTSEKL